ncbi:uncharacterized protein LOC122506094 [Leptopilina heterotoma]|uniref:uncharacterized protein LOC122506094 n=1 Tax=Leptopilina heterotoma TaxID=63436 RepID=UPI001CA816F1|nr:uncharacterized protein LOC122506094 [Leptopilina heterotoma]
MDIEISIQKHTTIELLGSVIIEDEELVYEGITFVDIANSLGKLVAIDGYVRTPIEKIVSNNSTYGSGAITDSYYRLPIHVPTFDTDEPIPAGASVKVQGRLRSNDFNTIILQVPNRENIKVINVKGLSLYAIRFGYHKILLKEKDNISINNNNKPEAIPPPLATCNGESSKTGEKKLSPAEKSSLNSNRRKYSDVVKNTIISKISRMDDDSNKAQSQDQKKNTSDESNITFKVLCRSGRPLLKFSLLVTFFQSIIRT